MWLPEESPSLVRIYDAMYRLGLVANCTGFFYTSYAVLLSVQKPERLTLVTKWLYPDVAKHYGTNWNTVEQGIRRSLSTVWKEHPELLAQLAGYQLAEKPTPAQFVTILANSISTIEGE